MTERFRGVAVHLNRPGAGDTALCDARTKYGALRLATNPADVTCKRCLRIREQLDDGYRGADAD